MALVHPFALVPCLLVPLALAAVFAPRAAAARRSRWRCCALAGGEALLLLDDRRTFNDFKAIYAPLHTPGQPRGGGDRARRAGCTCCSTTSPSGSTPTSPTMPGCSACPVRRRRFGLYRDGNRIAALPAPAGRGRTRAAMPARRWRRCPTRCAAAARAAGRRLRRISHRRGACARRAPRSLALEPEPVLLGALRDGFGAVAALAPPTPGVRLSRAGPIAAAAAGGGVGHHRPVVGFSRRGARPIPAPSPPRRSPPICAPWRRAASSPSRSRSASFRPTRCACWRPCAPACGVPASPIRRRMCWSSARPGTCASWCRRRAVRRRPDRGGQTLLRRTVIRHKFLPRHRRRGGAGEHIQRPAGGFLRGGRGYLRRRSQRRHRR